MENNNIKIKLDFAENVDVELDNMSITALESFLKVTTALKNIAASVSETVVFSLEKGSAAAVVHGTPSELQTIYTKIDEALDGESEDEIVTRNLRDIQSEIQNEVLRYQFFYSDIKLEEKIKNASRITKKRQFRSYRNEIRILTGKFNAVGGQVINYHLEYGSGDRETVECTQMQALELKDFLFQSISCLVVKKVAENDPAKPTFTHCTILEADQISRFRNFVDVLVQTNDILSRLDLIYDFFEKSPSVILDMVAMLKASSYIFDDVNELKTLLIISFGMRNNKSVNYYRNIVENNFKSQMSK